MDIDHRDADREAGDLAPFRPLAAATGDQAHVRRRAAHVEGDHVLEPARDATRSAPITPAAGPETRITTGCAAASSMVATPPEERITQRLGKTGRDDIATERLKVARDDGPEVGVGDGRRGAFVLTELGRDLVRGDDVHAGMSPS